MYALAVSGSNVYAGGNFTKAGGTTAKCIAKWNGIAWSALDSGLTANYQPAVRVQALAVSGNNVYVGGEFPTAGYSVANNIAEWDGSSWSALGLGADGYGVSALTISGSDLYAGGNFTMMGGRPAIYVGKWNGSSWSELGLGMNGAVLTLVVSSNAPFPGGDFLYAGGDFTMTTNNGGGKATVNHIAKWNGFEWSALGSGVGGPVYALAVSGSDVYAGGKFTTVTNNGSGKVTVNHIAKWDGNYWSALGSGMSDGPGSSFYSSVAALAVSGNDVYAGGGFRSAGGTAATNIAKWNGSSWSALGLPIGGYLPFVSVLAVSGSNVYAAGGYYIAKWDGSAWSRWEMDSGVTTLAVSGSNLYVGGGFTTIGGSIGGSNFNYIAKWNGSTWSTLGSGTVGAVHALAMSGSNLYVGGDFTIAGGKVSAYVARAILPDESLKFIATNSSFGLTNGLFGFMLTGPAPANAVIEASTNLQDWIPLATNPLTGGSTYFTDPQPANQSERFYRARLLP